jgi:hypothetical protein
MIMLLFYAYPAFAFTEPQPQNLEGITAFIGSVARWLTAIAGTIFGILFVLKGIKLASSSGNPNSKADAIGGLMWTGIGAIVAFGASYLVGVAMGIGQNPAGPLQ